MAHCVQDCCCPCGTGLIPGLGTCTCTGAAKKKKVLSVLTWKSASAWPSPPHISLRRWASEGLLCIYSFRALNPSDPERLFMALCEISTLLSRHTVLNDTLSLEKNLIG